ncbi:MAG TPA: YfhO family protein [Opitutaceae bacterium]|nr:YfhO family protein [Opitutaceae bacterium]
MRQRFGISENARALSPLFALAALWTLSFVAWKSTPLDGIDYVRFYQPYQRFLRESLWRGELPWWNPYSSLGRPFLIDLQAAAFYPATLLVIIFGAKAGWVIGTLVHGLIGAEGFRRLARGFGASAQSAVAGAAVFLFSGPVFGRMELGGVNYVYSLCFLPWVLWFASRIAERPLRRPWAALAATFALQLWGGHPQVFWLSALAAGLFTTGFLAFPPWRLAWRNWVRTELALLAACLAALALMGFVLVPFIELVGQSNRARPSLEFSGAFSMSGLQWASLVWPSWRAFGVFGEYNLFAGVAVAAGGAAAIALCRGPAARGAAFMAAGAAIIAAGPTTELFNVLYVVLPGMSSFRVPARAGVLVTLALILGAAMLGGKGRTEGRGRFTVLALAGGALLGAVLYAFHRRAEPFPAGWLVVQASFACLAGAGWWLWIGRGTGGRGLGLWASRTVLPMAVLGELCVSVHGIKRSNPFDSQFPGEATVIEAVRAIGADRQAAPARVCVDSAIFRENAGMVYRVASVVGYETLSLGRVWNYLHLAAGADPSQPFSTVPDGRIFNVAPGLRAFSLSASLALGSSRIKTDRQPDPRAYLATRMRIVADSRAAIQAMVSGEDFHGAALVESPYAGAFGPDPSKRAGTAAVARFALNAVDVEVASPGPAILVLAEAWYPGWSAQIDGRAVPCEPVNGWMRGVPVPAGKSVVRMHFHQNGLLAGLVASAAAAFALVLVWKP